MVSNSSTAGETGPVFIVGMNGSGTTMLLDHLNNHSAVFGFEAETRILPHYLSSIGRYGDLNDDANYQKLWKDMCGAFTFWQVNGRKAVPLPDDWARGRRDPATVFDHILKYFAAKEGKARWCEKTPMHVLHMLTLKEHFPDAKFIHIVRDGRDSAASFHRRWGYNPLKSIYRWKKVVTEGRRQGKLIGDDYCEVLYEDVIANPEQEMRRLCEFLALGYEEAVLHSSRKGIRNQVVAQKTIVGRSEKFKAYFPATRLAELERIAGSTLTTFGYRSDAPHSDEDPPGYKLLFWSALDALRQVRDEIERKRKSGGRRTWKVTFGRLKSAFLQKLSNRY